jgi:anti-sigma B factor antagonist
MKENGRLPTNQNLLSCDVAHEGAKTIVSVVGEVDLLSSPALRHCLLMSCSPGTTVVVDMAGVTFMDSTGLGVLVGARSRAQAVGGELWLRQPTPQIARVLEITGLRRIFGVAD